MRKKLKDEEKKARFGLSLDPQLLKLLKKYTSDKNIKISKFIQDIIKEHFDNINLPK